MKIIRGIATFLIAGALSSTCPGASTGKTSEHAGASAKESHKETTKDGESPSRNWQSILVETNRRVEIDQASIKKGGDGKIQAYGRILFDKPLPDAVSGLSYQILEALNVYDCGKRSFATLKRVFRKDEKTVLREEASQPKGELPVRTGTIDERMLRAVCRPGATDKSEFGETVAKAKAAAETPAAEPRKELLRTQISTVPKTVAPTPHAEPAKTHAAPKRPPAKHHGREDNKPEVHHWSYEGPGGPEHWGKLDPAYASCETGKRQSPIDIRDGIKVDLEPISFSYRPSLFRIINNGHTIQATVNDNRITLLGRDYELVQLHFHHPAEERIGGRGFDMVVHLVHRSHDGQMAVLAIMVERGAEHPVIQTLWNYLPLEANVDVVPPGVVIDLNKLLPEKRGYYTFMGSLTTPPCSEGIQWLVMQSPVQASAEQIAILGRLFPNNARPIQAGNGRLIKESR